MVQKASSGALCAVGARSGTSHKKWVTGHFLCESALSTSNGGFHSFAGSLAACFNTNQSEP